MITIQVLLISPLIRILFGCGAIVHPQQLGGGGGGRGTQVQFLGEHVHNNNIMISEGKTITLERLFNP